MRSPRGRSGRSPPARSRAFRPWSRSSRSAHRSTGQSTPTTSEPRPLTCSPTRPTTSPPRRSTWTPGTTRWACRPPSGPGRQPFFDKDIAVAAAGLRLLADADSPLRSLDGYPSADCLDMRVGCHVRPEFTRGQASNELEIRPSNDALARLLVPEPVEPRFEPRFVRRALFFAELPVPPLLAC